MKKKLRILSLVASALGLLMAVPYLLFAGTWPDFVDFSVRTVNGRFILSALLAAGCSVLAEAVKGNTMDGNGLKVLLRVCSTWLFVLFAFTFYQMASSHSLDGRDIGEFGVFLVFAVAAATCILAGVRNFLEEFSTVETEDGWNSI